ncbi:hypothetical protein VTO42DRAFT_6830 [Malbranchea cinnamomea]
MNPGHSAHPITPPLRHTRAHTTTADGSLLRPGPASVGSSRSGIGTLQLRSYSYVSARLVGQSSLSSSSSSSSSLPAAGRPGGQTGISGCLAAAASDSATQHFRNT